MDARAPDLPLQPQARSLDGWQAGGRPVQSKRPGQTS